MLISWFLSQSFYLWHIGRLLNPNIFILFNFKCMSVLSAWDWSYGELLVTMWVQGTKPGSFGRGVSTLNHWDIFPCIAQIFINTSLCIQTLFYMVLIKREDIRIWPEDRESVGWNFHLSIIREFQTYLYAGRNKPMEEKLYETNLEVWLISWDPREPQKNGIRSNFGDHCHISRQRLESTRKEVRVKTLKYSKTVVENIMEASSGGPIF